MIPAFKAHRLATCVATDGNAQLYHSLRSWYNKRKSVGCGMTILVYLLSAACIIYALFAFQGRGPLLATLYAVATKEEKTAIKTPSLYRFVAIVFLAIGIMLLLAGLGMQFALQWLFNVVIALGILLIIFVLVVSIHSEPKKA